MENPFVVPGALAGHGQLRPLLAMCKCGADFETFHLMNIHIYGPELAAQIARDRARADEVIGGDAG